MKIVGYSSEDLIGVSPVKHVHPEDIKRAVSAWRAGVISGEETVEIRYKKKDGDWIWLEIRGKKYTNLNGKPKGIIISRDITKRKKAEQKLKDSEKQLSTVLENSPDTILMIDRNDIIQYVNHIPEHFVEEPTIGKNFYKILMPENQDMYKLTFKKIFETGISKTIDMPGFAGTWCTTRFIPIYSEGRVNSIMLIITNITELKKAHEKIKESEEIFRSIYEHSPNSITLVNNQGIIVDVNPATEKIYGFSKVELIGKRFMDLGVFTSDQISLFQKRYEKQLNGEEQKPIELQIRKKDGSSAWIYYQSILIEKGDEILIESIAQDITEKKNSNR